MINDIIKNIKKFTKTSILQNEKLSKHSTIKIGGPAKTLLMPSSAKDLQYIIELLKRNNLPFFIFGNGSNIIFPDKGINGIVIKMAGNSGAFESVADEIICDSRILLPYLLKILAKEGLSGLEFTAGVPASLGGAVFSNLGAYGFKIGSFVIMAEGINHKGELKTIFNKDMAFSYRRTRLMDETIILTKIFLKLKKDSPNNIKKRITEFIKKRKLSQPLNMPNAGSIFKNPPGDFAGNLIEKAGLKGARIGNAQISLKHANVIVNLGGASARDVVALIDKAREEVMNKFNIALIPEVILPDIEIKIKS